MDVAQLIVAATAPIAVLPRRLARPSLTNALRDPADQCRIDRVEHTQRPFFDPRHHQHYVAFMDSCFDTHIGVAQNAKIRADPTKYEEEFASAWDSVWKSPPEGVTPR